MSGECSSKKPKIGRRGNSSPDVPVPCESPVPPDISECPAVRFAPKNLSNVFRASEMGLQMPVSAPVHAPVAVPSCKFPTASDPDQQENDPEDCDVGTSTQPEPSVREGEPGGPVLNPCDCCHPATEEACFGKSQSEECYDTSALEAMYEDLDWVTLRHLPMTSHSRVSVAKQVEAVRKVPFQLALTSLIVITSSRS